MTPPPSLWGRNHGLLVAEFRRLLQLQQGLPHLRATTGPVSPTGWHGGRVGPPACLLAVPVGPGPRPP